MLWESENRAEQCRILQIGTVDAGNGTLFGTRNKRAIQRDHLTLVIGSGGMGAATIHAAVQKARQNLESDFDNYTKFILVDSDWREIARMEKEQVEAEEKAVRYVAKAADGSMRDALSLLDQCIAFYLGQKLTYDHVLDVLGAVDTDVFGDLFRKICDQKLTDVVRELEQIILQGRELSQFVTDFIWYLRNLLMLKSDQNMEDVLDVSTERLAQMKKEADLSDTDTLMRYIRVLSELSGQLRYATQKRVLVELAMIKLCRPAMEQNYDSILQRIRVLEQQMEKGIPMMAAVESGAAQSRQETESRSQEKLPREALSTDVRMFVDRFQELRRKMGGMQSQQLKDAALRELPDGTGVQIILARELPVDEQELADSVEKMIERELKVRMKVQIHTPHTDPRPQDPVTDLSGFIDMDIDIEP